MARNFRELVDKVQDIVMKRKEVNFNELCYELGVAPRGLSEAIQVARQVHRHIDEDLNEEVSDFEVGDLFASELNGNPKSEWVLYEHNWFFWKSSQVDEAWAKVIDESVAGNTNLPDKAQYFRGFKFKGPSKE